mmetsp:Transcript_28377/g.57636  ORF Transcript_28377/g.57636 Transcript_28377/m.57636 type:complete len:282 (-) Transcript_28377:213-1058(-)
MVRRCDMGPCSSLATIPRDRRSTVARSEAVRPESLLLTRFSSCFRIFSARDCNLVIIGTVPSDWCHVPNPFFSSCRSSSASSTSRCRFAWFAATTALRSSTLYAMMLSSWLAPASSMLRGTLMSTSIAGRSTCSLRFSLVRIGSMAPVQANVTCDSATDFIMSGSRANWMLLSGNISCSSSTRPGERFTTVMLFTPRGVRCCTSSRAILPAPRMQMSSWFMSRSRSSTHFLSTSSTAAEEIDTPPRAMLVSDRTRLPADTAVLSSRVSTLPAAPSSSVEIS